MITRGAPVAYRLAGAVVGCAVVLACAASSQHGDVPPPGAGDDSGASGHADGGADAGPPGSPGRAMDAGGGADTAAGGGLRDASAKGPAGDAADAATEVGPGSYALPPPKQCDNQFYVPGCTPGVATSACGGTCSAQSACEGPKPNNPDIGFICPRFLLLSDEMLQAAKDDWGTDTPPFHYAIVGHDQDTAGIDGNVGTCCQCYELVFDRPSPSMDQEACVNADCSQGSAVAVPPPLVVQAFDFGATTTTFDVFMGAGGFGANNACDPNGTPKSASGRYMYTSFPDAGEPSGGGVKVVLSDPPWPADCKTSVNWLTSATLSSPACQGDVAAQCGAIQATDPAVAAETVRSCEQANAPSTFYHLNWQVYAKKIECPTHLTEVTGCKLAPQGLPAAQPGVTAAQASADASWRVYGTTTMQDCCKPSCAYQDNVSGKALTPVGQYDSFYTCDERGVPFTE
ncbi:MAG TPA: hypothetical protein VE987_08825 [Polyangiaceae bacterium]|nr:hypothetical protein [Polyangiaceae bacterium]